MFTLPALPFSYKDLQPFLSKEQVRIHYELHHAGYYRQLNQLISEDTPNQLSLDDIIINIDTRNQSIYNNVCQAWNHNLFWQCLSPSGGGEPGGELKKALIETFGNVEKFKSKFEFAAINHFGSGWCWLVYDKSGKIEIQTTSNADCPMSDRVTPLMTLDLWEHAYLYPPHMTKVDYVTRFWSKINWRFIEAKYQRVLENKG